MPEKQKAHNWKNPKTVIAAVSVSGLVILWNTFATHDRQHAGNVDLLVSDEAVTPETSSDDSCATPVVQAENLGKRCVTVMTTRSS